MLKLLNNGVGLAATVSAIVRMWNEDLLPHLRANTISAGKGISVDKHPGGTIITCTAGGRGGVSTSEGPTYSGYFKLVDASTYTSGALTQAAVKVVDGANVSGGTAGYCDLSGASAVATATMSFSTSATVNLYGWYTSGVGYSAAIGTSAPVASNVGSYQLGRVIQSGGTITILQDWAGGIVYFGTRYIV